MHSRSMTKEHVDRSVGNQAKRIKDALMLGEQMAEEYLDLWDVHGGDSFSVAKQLFKTESPDDGQLAMVDDWHAALMEFRRLFGVMDAKVLKRVS